jgi:hypothetical protein
MSSMCVLVRITRSIRVVCNSHSRLIVLSQMVSDIKMCILVHLLYCGCYSINVGVV